MQIFQIQYKRNKVMIVIGLILELLNIKYCKINKNTQVYSGQQLLHIEIMYILMQLLVTDMMKMDGKIWIFKIYNNQSQNKLQAGEVIVMNRILKIRAKQKIHTI